LLKISTLIRSDLLLHFAGRAECSSLRTACKVKSFPTGCSSTLLDYAPSVAKLLGNKSRIILSLCAKINFLLIFNDKTCSFIGEYYGQNPRQSTLFQRFPSTHFK